MGWNTMVKKVNQQQQQPTTLGRPVKAGDDMPQSQRITKTGIQS